MYIPSSNGRNGNIAKKHWTKRDQHPAGQTPNPVYVQCLDI